jgi:branched-chain amino acid transport system substrate-binding protein
MASKDRLWKARAGVGVLVSVLLFVSACGSSTPSSSGSSSSGNDLGTAKKATGDSVKIGFVYTGRTAASDASLDLTAGQAGASYANDYLGGLGGHPIEIVKCETTGTPAGATQCGNQMVQEKVAAVLINSDSNAALIYAAVKPANIPFFIYANGDAAVINSANAFVLTDSIATQLAAPAALARDNKAKKAVVMTIDVPAAVGPVRALADGFYKKAGVALTIVAIPAGTADPSPQVQTALNGSPDQIAIIGTASFCTSALKAIRSLGYSKTIVIIQQCIDTTAVAGIPNGYKDMKVFAASSTDTTDPEVKTYIAAMKKYAPGTDPFGGSYRGGYAVVVALARALSGATGPVTSSSIATSLQSAAAKPMPLATGQTFQCSGKLNTVGTAFCAAGALAATLAQDGSPVGAYKAVDVSDLYTK